MTSYGDFSPSDDPEDEAFRCTKNIIPVLPVRYSLLPYDTKGAVKPTSIGDTGDYIVRTLRRGFVYIYIERVEEPGSGSTPDNIWHVWRRTTDPQDINASYVPDGTDHIETSGGFAKYEFTDNYGAGTWRFEGQPSTWCWVPADASVIWMAYSEFRWPRAFFRDGHAEDWRRQMMTRVDLRGTNNHAATIGEAANLVEEWKPESDRLTGLRLNLSQTGFIRDEPPTWDVPMTEGNENCVAIAALADPLGDIREMGYRLEQIDDHRKSFHAAHAFPLTIGRFCEQLQPSIKPRDGRLDGVIFSGPALQPGWQASYLSLRSIEDTLSSQIRSLVEGILEHMDDSAPQMLGRHLQLAQPDADNGEEDAVEYWSLMFGTALAQISITSLGSASIQQGLGAPIDAPGPSLRTYLSRFRSVWGAMVNKPVEELVRRNYSFSIAFEAMAVELGMTMAQRPGTLATWAEALQAGLSGGPGGSLVVSKTTLPLEDAIKFLTNSQRGLSAGGMSPLTALDTTIGLDGIARTNQVLRGPSVDIPTIATGAGVEMVGGFEAAGRMAGYNKLWAGGGLFFSAWALASVSSAQAQADGLFERGAVSSVTSGRPFQVTTAAIGLAEGLRSFKSARDVSNFTRAQISSAALDTLYGRAASAQPGTLVTVNIAAQGAMGRAVATWLPRIAVFAGAAVSAGAAWRGIERQDRSEAVGNIAIAVGSLMLIPGLGWGVAVIGGIIIAVGFLISLTNYTPVEDVVRVGFYGTTSDYHHLQARLPIPELIRQTRNLPTPWDKAFPEEVARFGELTWFPVIENDVPGDGIIIVRSDAFGTGDENAVSITVRKQNSRRRDRWNGAQFSRALIPGSNAVRLTIRGVNASSRVRVTARVTGPRTAISHENTRTFENP